MAVINPQNLRPALADQESNILTGQLTRRDEINQAITNFEAQTGTSLADVLADTLALKNGNSALADDTVQLRADTMQLLADLVAVKADTGNALDSLVAVLADTALLKAKGTFPVITVQNDLSTNGTVAEELFSNSSPEWTVAHSYNGSGFIQQMEVYANYAINIFVDDNLAVHYPGNANIPSSKYKIINGDTAGTYLGAVFFEKSLRIEIKRVGNSSYSNNMKVVRFT